MHVQIKGVFMGANHVKQNGQNGQPDRHSIRVDVYQGDSPAANKAITVSVPEIEKMEALKNKYKTGAPVEFTATARAYNGNIYLTHESGLV